MSSGRLNPTLSVYDKVQTVTKEDCCLPTDSVTEVYEVNNNNKNRLRTKKWDFRNNVSESVSRV